MQKIVRIRKVDLPGDKKIRYILNKIKGIKFAMAYAILQKLNIDGDTLLGELPPEKIEELKKAIEDPASLGLPSFLFNRRKDMATGEDIHLTGMSVKLAEMEDIRRMQETKSWRGLRLAKGLKVRGQRTKAHPRKGATLGVITRRKAAKMQKKEQKKQKQQSSKQKGGKKK